jgi:hypothetical protein
MQLKRIENKIPTYPKFLGYVIRNINISFLALSCIANPAPLITVRKIHGSL